MLGQITELTFLFRRSSQSPAPTPSKSTSIAANSVQYASVKVDTTRAAVDIMIQNLRRYLDEEESDKAPKRITLSIESR